jgi:hypothetical protein
MNLIFQGIFKALWPGLVQAVEGLLEHAKGQADSGNHDAAHAAVSAIAGIAGAAVESLAPTAEQAILSASGAAPDAKPSAP